MPLSDERLAETAELIARSSSCKPLHFSAGKPEAATILLSRSLEVQIEILKVLRELKEELKQ